MAISDALIVALIGMLVVFAVLILLMVFIRLMSTLLLQGRSRSIPAVSTADNSHLPTPAVGSCGELRLRNVSEETAAMIMAIVADELDAPLNELHFISIAAVDEPAEGGKKDEI